MHWLRQQLGAAGAAWGEIATLCGYGCGGSRQRGGTIGIRQTRHGAPAQAPVRVGTAGRPMLLLRTRRSGCAVQEAAHFLHSFILASLGGDRDAVPLTRPPPPLVSKVAPPPPSGRMKFPTNKACRMISEGARVAGDRV